VALVAADELVEAGVAVVLVQEPEAVLLERLEPLVRRHLLEPVVVVISRLVEVDPENSSQATSV
jgi:hypothetical protein